MSAGEADSDLKASDRILGVELNGVAKAYPIRILNWHEIVNDEVGGRPILVSWCPLCGSGVVYDPRINHRRYTFGVSGLLYQRNLLLYDRQTESLWSQLLAKAIAGPMAGTPLPFLPAVHATWAAWKKDHPDTLALSFQTGYRRDYSRDPYADLLLDRRQALVVEVRGNSKIYPYSELRKAGPNISDEIAGEKVIIQFDSREQTAYFKGAQGEPVSSFVVFFADARAFYPHAPVFKAR